MIEMEQEQIKKVKQMLKDNSINFNDFYDYLQTEEFGNWDSVNSEDTIKQYVNEMSLKGIHVSHILQALEENPSSKGLYCIWLGNSMETPTPINNKNDLFEALEISSNGNNTTKL